MELNEIVALLETQFPGVRKDGLNQLARVIAMQVNTKEEATGIAGKLTAEAVAKFVADWRKDADAEIDKANKTREENLRKKYDFVEKNPEDGGTPPAPAGALDAATVQTMITNAVKEATKGLQSEVMSLQSAAVTAHRREELVKVLGNDVPESFKATVMDGFEGRTFADEKAFSEFLDKTKANVATFTQELADEGLSLHEKPVFGSPNKNGVSAGVESYIQAKAAEAENKGLGGKEV